MINKEQIPTRGAMHFSFTLSMPGVNSWNGKWSGKDRQYVRVKSFTTREWKRRIAKLIGYHTYSFGDGWVAGVEVKAVDATTKRNLLKKTAGFCGYDWMIYSLIDHGVIKA